MKKNKEYLKSRNNTRYSLKCKYVQVLSPMKKEGWAKFQGHSNKL